MKKTIVVAEDNTIMGLVIERYLIRNGYAVHVFGNGYDALLFLQENLVDLLITDIEMPVLDGWGLIKQVRATVPGRLPIIVLSSFYEPGIVDRVISEGGNAYIEKSIKHRQLYGCINEMVK